MSPKERQILQKIDDIVMNASSEELKKIQEADIRTQLDGVTFYDVYVSSENLTQQIIEQKTSNFKK